jgi:regulator of protease activity HflC (stomatin/prohibitin superfamily)
MLFIFSIVAVVVSFTFWRSASQKLEQKNVSFKGAASIAGLVTVLFSLLALSRCVTVVPAGNVGVIDVFGTVGEVPLKAGINFMNPFARVVLFSVKTQELKEVMDVPSREGLTVQLEVSVLYHVNPERAADIYKTVGENYVEVILEPQFRSVSRGVTAGYEARALYTSEREQLALQILKELEAITGVRGIEVESTPLRRVGLPPGLTQAIEEKLRMEQESQRMQFVLTKEQQEADRKRIEAQGIADFQNIVAKGISEPLLRWKGIEATTKLAESQNAKVVIIGSGKDGLPIILDSK